MENNIPIEINRNYEEDVLFNDVNSLQGSFFIKEHEVEVYHIYILIVIDNKKTYKCNKKTYILC